MLSTCEVGATLSTLGEMALFEFELRDPADIIPWRAEEGPSLSWFALTDGWFHMPVGDQVLFEYSEEVRRRCNLVDCRADYQIAAFARDILECASFAMSPLPPRVERLAADWDAMKAFEATCLALDEKDDPENIAYDAWRWSGERSPWTSYLNANPRLSFLRIGDAVRIHWNNLSLEIEGVMAWTAGKGAHTLPADMFLAECRNFSDQLLAQMAGRIDSLERGRLRTQVPLDFTSLRRQHQEWASEFADYFRPRKPDLCWEQTERALSTLAKKIGMRF